LQEGGRREELRDTWHRSEGGRWERWRREKAGFGGGARARRETAETHRPSGGALHAQTVLAHELDGCKADADELDS